MLHQLDTLIDSRMRRHAIKLPQLIHTHPQTNPNFAIESPSSRLLVNQKIQLRLPPHTPKHNLSREPGITTVQPLRKPNEEVRRISSILDTKKTRNAAMRAGEITLITA